MTAVLPFPTKPFPREGVDAFRLALCCVTYLMKYSAKDARIAIGTWRKCGFLREQEADALLGFYGMDVEEQMVCGADVHASPATLQDDLRG